MNNTKGAIRLFSILLLALWGGVPAAVAQTPTNGLVAYYPFNGDAVDASGNGNSGAEVGGVGKATDRFGNACGAMGFDGRSGYIEVSNSSSLQRPTNQFAVTSWFYIENAPNPSQLWLTLVCKGIYSSESNSNPQYRAQFQQSSSGSNKTISINTEVTEYFDINIRQNQWYFFALTYDGSRITAYLNNQQVFSHPYSKPLSPNSAPLHIGKDIPGSTEYFAGRLDELRLYSRSLSYGDIMNLYNDKTGAGATSGVSASIMPNITTNTNSGVCYSTVYYNEPDFSTDCGTISKRRVSGQASGSRFSEGANSVVYVASTASGPAATSQFFVNVVDKENPKINCPADIQVDAQPGAQTAMVSYTTPTATDNCQLADNKLISGLSSGSAFPVGSTTVSYKATDKNGNSATCSFNVEVIEKSQPKPNINVAVNCINDIEKEVAYNINSAAVNYISPQLFVNGNAKNMTLIQGYKSGEQFPVGLTKVVYQGTDDTGGVHSCTFNVNITQRPKPKPNINVAVNCIDDIEREVEYNVNSVRVNYSPPQLMVNGSAKAMTLIRGYASGEEFPVGFTNVMYQGTDDTGGVHSCAFNVLVKQKPKPQTQPDIQVAVECGFDMKKKVAASVSLVKVDYTTPTLVVNGVSKPMTLKDGYASGQQFPVGRTTVIYEGTDDTGGVHNCSFDVVVEREQPKEPSKPVIACLDDIEVECSTGDDFAVVNFAKPLATQDNKAIDVSRIKGPGSGSKFPVGTTEVVFQAKGVGGKTAMCSFNVVVECEPTATASTDPDPLPDNRPTVLDANLNLGKDTISYEEKELNVSSCEVTLYGYDGREYDHDTITIVFNGEVLVNKAEIVNKTNNFKKNIKLDLKLKPNQENILILKAWNEGFLEYNTLEVEIYEEKITKNRQLDDLKPKRIELRAKPGYAKAVILKCP